MKVEFLKLRLTYIEQQFTLNPSYSYLDRDIRLHSFLFTYIPETATSSALLSENSLMNIYARVGARLCLSPKNDDSEIRTTYDEIYQTISKKLIIPSYVRAFIRKIESQIYKSPLSKTTELTYQPKSLQTTIEQTYLRELKYFILAHDRKIEPISVEALLKMLDILNQRIMQTVKYNVSLEQEVRTQYREFASEINLRVQVLLSSRVHGIESEMRLQALNQMTVADIRSFLTRFNQRFGSVKNRSPHPRFMFDVKYLKQLQELFKDLRGVTPLSKSQLEQVIEILHARDLALRDSDFHYTKDTYDPMNLNYIELGSRIAKYLGIPLSRVLMKIDNETCVNLDYAINKLKFVIPNGRRGLEVLNQYSGLREWDTIRFAPPELYGIYFWKNRMNTMVGLLAINGVTFDVSLISNDNNRPVYFLKIKEEVFKSFFTLNKEGKKRGLHIKEIAQFMNQKNDIFEDSKSLSLRDSYTSAYRTAWAPIESKSVRYWKDKGILEHGLVFKLIEYYLNTDPLLISDPTLWLTKLNQWCDDLLLQYNSNGEIIRFRPHEDVNCIYGQVVVDEKSFLYEHIVSLIKDSSELNIDNQVHKIAAWYCGATKGEDANDIKIRLRTLDQKYTSLLLSSIERGRDLLSNPKLRYLKLISSLKVVVDKKFYDFKINAILRTSDAITFEPLSTIPPEDRLLSEEGDVIYDLRICLNYYKRHGQFRNVYLSPIGWFTPIEMNRIRNNSRYREYVKNIEDENTAREICKISNSSLKTSTIIAIRDFVNRVYHLGAEDFSMSVAQVNDYATDEFDKFKAVFYLNLDAEEKERLDSYQIFNGSKRIRISEIFANIIDSVDGKPKTHTEYTFCLNEILHPLFQMIIDHDDAYRFRRHIELMPFSSLDLEGPRMLEVMRKKSQKLVCSDNDKESTKKLKAMLFVAKLELDYGAVCFKDFWNELVASLESIVNTYLINQTIDNAFIIYTDLIESKVNIEITRISNMKLQHSARFTGSSPEIEHYLDTLKKIKLKYSEDECKWYELSYLVIHLKKRIDSARDADLVVSKLRTAYQEILGKFAYKISYVISVSSDRDGDEIQGLIEFFTGEGINILAYPRGGPATHMLDIEGNMIWQKLLNDITEEQASPLRRFMERGTPSNSFTHST
jgi:hypothetical protein